MIGFVKITDLKKLLLWRAEVIENVFGQKAEESLLEENRKYYEKHLADGTHIAFVAVKDDTEVGCGALCLTEELPSPDNPNGLCAYIMNVYVRLPYREQGIGHNIVRHLLDAAKARDCGKIYLETTSEGRPVYQSIGFKEMPDMMKYYG